MRFFESVIYGVFSGLAEFLPVSTQAQQVFCLQLFGRTQREPLRDLFVHIALMIALFHAGKSIFDRVRREKKLLQHSKRGSIRHATGKSLLDMRVIRAAALPMLVILLFYMITIKWEAKPGVVSLMMVINGIILIIPEYMRHGNKDARGISGAEGLLIGIVSGLSVLPGVSRIGGCISAATACGADRQSSVNWALMLTVPALALYMIIDIVNMFVIGFVGFTFLAFLGYLISAVVAYLSGYFSVLLLRFLAERTGFAGFAYYSWGAALLMFVLYLIT